MIRVVIDEKPQTLKETKRMVNSYWNETHGECCGNNVSYEWKERWFIENHEEHTNDEQVTDIYEWEWLL